MAATFGKRATVAGNASRSWLTGSTSLQASFACMRAGSTQAVRALSGKASSQSWSDEWKRLGLGATKAASDKGALNRLLFVQCGFGCDQHGDRTKGSTKAAVRAVRNAIEFNSIPGAVFAVPGGRERMLVHVKLGVPGEAPHVDLDEVAKVFPYGQLLPIEVVPGGLAFGSGRIVPELGDTDDTALVVCACVSIGYHDPTEGDAPRVWSTRDGH